MPKLPGFVGPSYTSDSVNFAADRSLNLYPELDESGTAKNVASLRGTPGLELFGTLPTMPVRGLWAGGAPLTTGARLFAVGGSILYEIDSAGVATAKGSVGTDASNSPVQIFPNGNQLCIISAGNLYIDNGAGPVQPTYLGNIGTVTVSTVFGTTYVSWESGDIFDALMTGRTITINGVAYTVAAVYSEHVLTTTTPAVVGGPYAYSTTGPVVTARTGAVIDSYFIAQVPDSKQFNISAINNGLLWDPIDHGIKEAYPDNIGSILADHQELWVFGEATTEVFRDTGNADFPFERDPGSIVQMGIAAPWSAVRLANGVAWLGADTRSRVCAYRATGPGNVARVSTHAVEVAWSAYSTVADVQAYAYSDQGHEFWILNFPTANATWAYDVTTKLWHERGWWNGTTVDRQRGRCHAFCFGFHLVGDHTNGKIYKMGPSYYSDDGTSIQRVRTAPHISDENGTVFHHKFQLDMETGTGTAATVALDYSNDGGHTWSTSHNATTGAASAWSWRVIWRRLGRSRDRVYRISILSAVKITLINAYLEFTKGDN